MSFWAELRERLRAFLFRSREERELEAEVRFHIEMESAKLVSQGVAPEEARRRAKIAFGGVERHKEAVREARGMRGLEDLWADLRYAARTLRKSPGFTLVAVLTLALGIGATTAIFSVVNALLLRPLPIEDQERVVMLWKRYPEQEADRFPLSLPEFRYWRDQNETFDAVAAFLYIGHWSIPWKAEGTGEPEQVATAPVSYGFFTALGMRPVLGRAFLEEDDRAGAPGVAVVSHGFWQRRLGASPDAVGHTLESDGHPYTIIGVLPPGFGYPEGTEIWVPVQSAVENADEGSNFYGIGRLAPGITIEDARAELQGLTDQFASADPGRLESLVVVRPLAETIVGEVRLALLVLLGAVGLVLAMAAANVASLLLVRTAARKRELAVRTALGAGGWRVVRPLLCESLLLALSGGVFGVVIAAWGLEVLLALAPETLPRTDGIRIDGLVLGFSLLVSLVSAVGLGLAPALQSRSPDLTHELKAGGERSTGSLAGLRLKRGLVIGEIALALVLLTGAGLLIQSLVHRQQVGRGFVPENLLSALLPIPASKYPDPENRLAFFERLAPRIEGLPGVSSATPVLIRSLTGAGGFAVRFVIEGQAEEDAAGNPIVNYEAVAANYFRTAEIPLFRGRGFTTTDREDSTPVVVVNRTLARRYWPGENPLGKQLKAVTSDTSPWRTVVGVVEDVYPEWELTSGRFTVYVPARQSPWSPSVLLIRTASNPAALIPAIRREIRAMDADVPVDDIASVEQLLWTRHARPRFNTVLLALFAAIALGFAAVGAYGAMASFVGQRTHEIGVRMALGAGAGNVRRHMLREGIVLAVAGLALGVAMAWVATRALSSLVFGISPTDPVTFTGVVVLLGGVALLASYLPARRVTRVDPLAVLRSE